MGGVLQRWNACYNEGWEHGTRRHHVLKPHMSIHEVSLALLHRRNHQDLCDATLIYSLWKEIVDEDSLSVCVS